MNFIRKNIKLLIGIIIGLVIASTIVVYAAINANTVDYKNNQKVSDALNELYTKVPSGSQDITANGTYNIANKASVNVSVGAPSMTFNLINDAYSTTNSQASFDVTPLSNQYKYFKIIGLYNDTNTVKTSRIWAWSLSQSAEIDLNLNQQYEIKSTTDGYKFSGIFLTSNSTSSVWSRCKIQITLYN